uniref:Capsid protein n=1 Tax=Torque teno virus TaxID=68887 RepID=A0A7L8Y9Z1_9VIRU|nr:ORF1 [Torque teno virus]
MAWSWWWQRWRRRRWKPRRRRWRRLRRRRPRRPVRRRRRGRRVRRRRWGRRRGRRRRYATRRKRRTRGRNFKKKLVLTQWHPSSIRRCLIKGIVPLVICGHTRWNWNYALHSEDYTEEGRFPHGGSLSTTTWSLKVLYDEYLKHHNFWGYPNNQLDLARYKGAKFTFYRHKKTDFIAFFNRKPPFKLNKYSCASYHPGMLMQQRHKVLIPSYDTKPKGRPKITVRIKPPTLLEDKWYTQQDLCDVNLLQLVVTAADFQHPFCSPQTNTPTTTFQVLKDIYYNTMSISEPPEAYTNVNKPTESKSFKDYSDELEKILYERGSYWNSFHALEYLNAGITDTYNNKIFNSSSTSLTTWLTGKGNSSFQTGNSTQFGHNSYKPTVDNIRKARKAYWTALEKRNDLSVNIAQAKAERFEYHLGWYSPILLSHHRSNLNFARAYQDVTYNPNCDRGVKNRIWVQPLTKPTTEFDEKRCKCVVENLPLWSAFYCYHNFVEEELGISSEIYNSCIIVVQCPYTFPPLYDKKLPKKGYVFYDPLFGNGKMPDGRGQIDVFWQQRWYPRMATQTQVMHDITMTGPFSYHDELVSTQLTAKYTFDFMWGGNMISTQIIKNPCKDSGLEPAYPGRQRRDLQIVDPHSMGPQFSFHNWDYRRGLFGQDAIDRVSKEPRDAPEYPNPYKRPRYFPPTDRADQEQEKDFNFQEESGASSSEESDQEVLQETQVLQFQPEQQQQLHLQLAQQQRLGEQLRFLLHQMFKTQANLHLNPYTYTQL